MPASSVSLSGKGVDQIQHLLKVKIISIIDDIGLPVPAFPAGKQFSYVIFQPVPLHAGNKGS